MSAGVSAGGQIAKNLAEPFAHAGYSILDNKPEKIHAAENRGLFPQIFNDLSIDHPKWQSVTMLDKAKAFANNFGNFNGHQIGPNRSDFGV